MEAEPTTAQATGAPVATPQPDAPGPGGRGRLGQEVLLVLGLTLGFAALSALIDLAAALTAAAPLSAQHTTLNGSQSARPYVDLARQLLSLAAGVLPVGLVGYLLARDGLRLPGLDRRHPRGDVARGAVLAAVIGIPGLGLYLLAHALDGALTVVPENLPDVWWRIPVLVGSAAQNGLVEECVVVAYLLTRLDALGWSPHRSLAASALLRGSYHLYQGFGAFAGNAAMGVLFVVLYRRWGRVMPLVIAHTLIDAVTFVGYAELAGHVSWLPT